MHRLPHPFPIRLCTFALLVLVVIANSLLSTPISENVLMALLALGGTLIAADTARPSGMARGADPRPLSPEIAEQVRRVKAALERPAPAVTPGSGRPPAPELIRRPAAVKMPEPGTETERS